MQHPQIHLNYVAMAVAVFACFFFSFIWWGPLFGRTWGKLMNLPMDKKPSMNDMMPALGLQLLGTILMVYVLAHSIQVWRPTTWGVGTDMANTCYGFFAGFYSWLGFILPLHLGTLAWERKPFKLFLINTAGWFLNLQVAGAVLACWPKA